MPPNNSTAFNLNEAILIATHTKTYTTFPELSYWMDMPKLYKQLDIDSIFRSSNDTLLNFYDSLQTEAINTIESTESRLGSLIESMESMNYPFYLQRLAEAALSYSNIVSATVQEENEQDINSIYLKILQYGLDTLSADDSARIKELSIQCPYIGGTAVYKARALYAMYAPASMFDDIKICNAVGVYKNGGGNDEDKKGIFDDENAFLRGLKPNTEKSILVDNEFIIYPNPANNQINIRYKNNDDTKLQIVYMLGVVVKEIYQSKELQQVSLLFNDLVTGVYCYRQIQGKVVQSIGKLIIVN